nr:cytoskeleton-associated protein 2-like [Nerophis lumbriciformis]
MSQGNKENLQPKDAFKSLNKKDFSKSTPAVSVQFKNAKLLQRNGASKITSNGEVQTKVKSTRKDLTGGSVSGVKQQQIHHKVILTEKAVKSGKVVKDTLRRPVGATSSKVAPGMYKGKIVESKIGSIWKSSVNAQGTESRRLVDLAKRSKSISDVPGRGLQNPAPPRSKSVSDGRVQASKPAATGRPPAPSSIRPLVNTVVSATNARSRNATVAPAKPKIALTDKKVKKPPVASTLSQYRCRPTETVEEKREKLQAWLALKGKTLKRPAMTSGHSVKTVMASANPKVGPKSQSQCHVEAKPGPEAQEVSVTVQKETTLIMNTTLDLLENSSDLPVVQDEIDGVVVNLCDAMEAMQMSSKCIDELPQSKEEVQIDDKSVKDGLMNEDTKELIHDEQSAQMDEQCQSDVTNADMDGASQLDNAYVVKYNIKTTPYLQSVKRTIEGEVQKSASRRKSNIKDLKFLTPVRRSRRIERKSLHLPSAVLDHDPCVSSLAELAKLDDDLNAYVYRKNTAILGELQDQVEI